MSEEGKRLEDAMSKPKKVEIDGKVVENNSLSDVIALDRYMRTVKASRKSRHGFRVSRMEASGTV